MNNAGLINIKITEILQLGPSKNTVGSSVPCRCV